MSIIENNSIDSYFADFISAKKIKNYIMDDPLIDWLNLYGDKKNIKPDIVNNDFQNFLMNKGVEFENHVLKKLRTKLGYESVVTINESMTYKDRLQKTVDLMNNGIPIIHSGFIINEEEKIFGIPDILIRSDYITHITNFVNIKNLDLLKNGCKFSNDWHYIIIDIKYSNLCFKKNDNTLTNKGLFPCYKSQLIIYNKCLSKLQDYDPTFACILGRKWTMGLKKGNNIFDYLGIIDIYGKDKNIYLKTLEAIKWKNDLKKNGINWDFNNPKIFPNLKNCNSDSRWNNFKNQLALKNKDITLLWNCGVNERNFAIKNNITDWNNSEGYSNKLTLTGKRGRIIDNIIKVNRENNILIHPRKIKNISNIRKLAVKKLEFICDFETVNDLDDNFKRIPYSNFDNCIFMIGLITNIYDSENKIISSEFNCFIVNKFDRKEEKKIIQEWLFYMDNLKDLYNIENPNIYHWSSAEPNFYKSAIIRNKKLFSWKELNFVDVMQIFKEEPITIKGCFNFGLKDVSKSLYKLGFINTTWKDDMDGRIAMLEAVEGMKKAKKERKNFKETEIVKNIKEYNYVDVQVINEILFFLRNKI